MTHATTKTTAGSAATELIIGRTRYALTKRDCEKVPYELRGVRGAIYGLMRNLHQPHVLFAIDGRGFGLVGSLRNVTFTDRSGVLEVIR